MNLKSQKGVTTVEFAIIGSVVLMVLFSVIEIGRAMFVLSTLGETTRRAARIAAVCPVNDPAIAEVALFNAPGGGTGSRIVGGLTPANIETNYLDINGAVIGDPTANFSDIRFIRSRIVDFDHQMFIPFAQFLFTTPDFATTVRRESLGVPRVGAVQPC
jgi:hypothetical protein